MKDGEWWSITLEPVVVISLIR